MNERIRELARQSTGAGTVYMLEDEWTKFAELIVRECASQVIEHQPRYLTRGQAQEMANTIKEHFGIEQ